MCLYDTRGNLFCEPMNLDNLLSDERVTCGFNSSELVSETGYLCFVITYM